MILSHTHVMDDLKELWEFKSFRMRVFFAIAPTLAAAAFGYLAIDRTRPYDYILAESYIQPPSGRGGDQVTVSWKVKVNRKPCPGTAQRVLVDPSTDIVVALYDPVLATQGPTVNDRLNITFSMPKNLHAGWVGYKAYLTYQCNWLQSLFPAWAIRYQTPTLLFRVEE